MRANPRISVITPSYNQGSFLERTIRSVLDQGYPNLQYLIFDGGSTDNSVEIIEKYSAQLDYWVSQPDGGQASALNAGLKRCDGDIVAYINSDDWYAPDTFSVVAEEFSRNIALRWLVGTCAYQSSSGSSWLRGKIPLDRGRWVGEGLWLPQASSFWDKRMFDNVGPFRSDMHYSFDLEFGVRALFAGYRPQFIAPVLAHRWLHDDCKTVALPEKFHQELDRFIELFSVHLNEQELRDAKSLALRRYLQLYIEGRHYGKALRTFLRLARQNLRSALSFSKSTILRALGLASKPAGPWNPAPP